MHYKTSQVCTSGSQKRNKYTEIYDQTAVGWKMLEESINDVSTCLLSSICNAG